MDSTQDHYAVLGVKSDAGADEIRKAYRRLARELHPDVNPDPVAHERFKTVTYAYEVLSDERERQDYDRGWVTVRTGRWKDPGDPRTNPFQRPGWDGTTAYQDWIHGMRQEGWHVRVRYHECNLADERWSGDYEGPEMYYGYDYDDRGDGNTRGY